MSTDPRAVLTRPAPPPDHTIRYGDHPDQVVDLRWPAVTEPVRPLVVVIHGGFWRAEYDRAHTGPLAAGLAAGGYPVAQLEYRRTGQSGGGWPGTFDDVSTGLQALPGRLRELAGDRFGGPPVLLGHSAGGHLALWWADQSRQVRAVVALAPVADLSAAHRLDLDEGAVVALLGGGPREVPERYQAAQPRRPMVPVTVLHGDQDQQVPVAMSRRWVAAAQAAGGDVDLMELSDIEHFGLIDPTSPAWPAVVRAIASYC